MEYCIGNLKNIIKKGSNINKKNCFWRKSWDLLEWHPKAHHQHIIVTGKANAIDNHLTKVTLLPIKTKRRILKLSSNQKWRQRYQTSL